MKILLRRTYLCSPIVAPPAIEYGEDWNAWVGGVWVECVTYCVAHLWLAGPDEGEGPRTCLDIPQATSAIETMHMRVWQVTSFACVGRPLILSKIKIRNNKDDEGKNSYMKRVFLWLIKGIEV